jgi:hypothetical protein
MTIYSFNPVESAKVDIDTCLDYRRQQGLPTDEALGQTLGKYGGSQPGENRIPRLLTQR